MVEGIPILLPWARGGRFSAGDLLARHREPARSLLDKISRRLLPAPAPSARDLAAWLVQASRPRDAVFFGRRPADPAFLAAVAFTAALPTGPVLDLGCGCGHLLRILSRRDPGRRVCGVDRCFSLLLAARRFLAPDALLICADAELPLPFEDRAFAAAACLDVLPYLEEPLATVRELGRVAPAFVLGHLHDPDAPSAGARSAPTPALLAPLAPLVYSERRLLEQLVQEGAADLSCPGPCPSGVPLAAAGITPRRHDRALEILDGPTLNPVYAPDTLLRPPLGGRYADLFPDEGRILPRRAPLEGDLRGRAVRIDLPPG